MREAQRRKIKESQEIGNLNEKNKRECTKDTKENVRKETMEIQTVGNANNAEESERMRYTQ